MEYEIKVDYFGTKWWYLAGKLHREDGPAIEFANGDKEWYLAGILHREDGPAVEWVDGYKEWRLNGLCHREWGPAVERANGDKEWCLEGQFLTKETWFELIPEQSKIKILFDESFIKG